MTDRPAQLVWCVVCREARPFQCVEIVKPSRQHKEGFDGDRLVCEGCRSTLVSVYARIEVVLDCGTGESR